MRQQFPLRIVVGVIIAVALSGCLPSQPAYLFQNSDLSHYIGQATDMEFPDTEHTRLAEVDNAQAPYTLTDPFESGNFWDLQLEEAVSIALHNSKVIRSLGSSQAAGQPDALIAQPGNAMTIYNPALVETNPLSGVEGALSEFDAKVSSSLFWDRTDRPQNVTPTGSLNPFLQQDAVNFRSELSKKTANGTELFFRNVTQYDRNNNPFRALPSAYTTAIEAEARHPLLRGRGAQVNRIPVMIARINNDISLADFEANVRNLVMDVENAYWDLQCNFRILNANKTARDRALEAWQDIKAELNQAGDGLGQISVQGGGRTVEDELRAKAQYFAFRAQVQNALRLLYNKEANLRWLLGLAATDGRLIRPIDPATTSNVVFDWNDIHAESLVRSAELRRQQWTIKQREMELIVARNQLLPDLNVTALYRWLGVGDNLTATDKNGLNFPAVGSTAIEGLTQGDSQEFRLGFEFAMPVGFRRELAGIRNGQLGLARERARLQDMELNISHLLSQSVRDMDGNLVEAETYFNQYTATSTEVETLLEKQKGGEDVNIDYILRAYQRAVSAEILYHQAVCAYNKAIAFVHFRKGSLLEYNNVQLAEGPWPQKAYWDAQGHARRRSASHYLDYGWTRPRVISQGPVPQQTGTSSGAMLMPTTEGIPTPAPTPIPVPSPRPVPTPQRPAPNVLPMPVPSSAARQSRTNFAPIVNSSRSLTTPPAKQPRVAAQTPSQAMSQVVTEVLSKPEPNVRQASFNEIIGQPQPIAQPTNATPLMPNNLIPTNPLR